MVDFSVFLAFFTRIIFLLICSTRASVCILFGYWILDYSPFRFRLFLYSRVDYSLTLTYLKGVGGRVILDVR